MKTIFKSIYQFFYDGFIGMTLGKTLWLIIAIKLFIMFAILRIFFFPNYLNSKFSDDRSKGEYVGQELLNKSH